MTFVVGDKVRFNCDVTSPKDGASIRGGLGIVLGGEPLLPGQQEMVYAVKIEEGSAAGLTTRVYESELWPEIEDDAPPQAPEEVPPADLNQTVTSAVLGTELPPPPAISEKEPPKE